jgi:hypothetical protein
METGELHELHDFSLVLGGPTYQFFRKCNLAGDALQLLYRQVIFITLFAWLPLLLLDLFTSATRGAGQVSFFRDVEVQARFLVALPVLIAAELVVHRRIRPVVRTFVDRRIVLPRDLPRFDKAVASAIKLRNSIPLELGLLLVTYTVGIWVWAARPGLTASWYASGGGRWKLTPAGYWYVFVSIPVFQFILLRWYLRLFIWFRFLWQVSRLELKLIPTHPDRAAGLGFLGRGIYAFGPLLFAEGAICAGLIGSRVLYAGENLMAYKMDFLGFLAFFLFTVLAPLVVFTPAMERAKRNGLSEYGMLAQQYVAKFEKKWVQGEEAEELLGTGDIQSLADLGNSYQVVREMRLVPFGVQDVMRLSASIAAPFLPLLLTMFSAEELIMRILKMAF